MQELDLVNGFDVSDPEAWEHVGSVDLACLNAGVLTGDDGDIADLTDEQYRRAVGVNVDGVVFGVRRLGARDAEGEHDRRDRVARRADGDRRRPDLRR